MLFRDFIGNALRHERVLQGNTLRGVSFRAGVSLGYLSEVERGMKEPSSEVIHSVCQALSYPLPDLLRAIADDYELLTARETIGL